MAKAGPLVTASERIEFEAKIREQALDTAVPASSRGVPGAIFQTNLDIPAANETLPGERSHE